MDSEVRKWAACGQALRDVGTALTGRSGPGGGARAQGMRKVWARLVLLLAQLRRVGQVLQRAAAALAKVLAARRHLRRSATLSGCPVLASSGDSASLTAPSFKAS